MPPKWWLCGRHIYGMIVVNFIKQLAQKLSILGHDWLYPVNRLSSRETTPTQGHHPLNLAELPNLIGLQELHAHTKHTAGMQLCVGFHPNSQIDAFTRPCRSHTSATMGAGALPLRTLLWGWDTPSYTPMYILAQGACRKTDFFPKVCSTYLVIFTHLDLFLRELSFFK